MKRDGEMQIEPIVLPAELLSIVLPGRDVHISRENDTQCDLFKAAIIIHTEITHNHTCKHTAGGGITRIQDRYVIKHTYRRTTNKQTAN